MVQFCSALLVHFPAALDSFQAYGDEVLSLVERRGVDAADADVFHHANVARHLLRCRLVAADPLTGRVLRPKHRHVGIQ